MGATIDSLSTATAAAERPDLAAGTATTEDEVARPVWRRAVDAVLVPIAVLLLARVVMTMVLVMAESVSVTSVLYTPAWDSHWYVSAAQLGWPHHVPLLNGQPTGSTLVFFPGFPVLIRAVHLIVPVNWNQAGAGAALLTEMTMVVAFWVLTNDIWDKKVADRALVLLCFFPGAYIFSMLYAEPLLITAAIVCIYALRKGHWWLAGAAAALATATHSNGVALIACCAWEAGVAIHARREWRSLVAPILAPAGIVVWFAYLWRTTGVPLVWFDQESKAWHEQIAPLAFVHLVQAAVHSSYLNPNLYIPVACTVATAGLVVVMLRTRVPAVFWWFTAIVLAMSVTSNIVGLRPRFVLTAFPLIMVLGYRLRDTALSLVTSCFAALMATMLVVTVANHFVP